MFVVVGFEFAAEPGVPTRGVVEGGDFVVPAKDGAVVFEFAVAIPVDQLPSATK